MKSKDFAVNEGLVGSALGSLGNIALNKITGVTSTEQRRFLKIFSDQLKTQLKLNPNLTIDDFLDLYWKKNNWDISNIPASYQQSIDDTKQLVASDPNNDNIAKLGNAVYNVAIMLPGSRGAMANQQTTQPSTPTPTQPSTQTQQSNTNPAAGNGQIDPDTTQIISKIRSMGNTPDEIDDLVDIMAISMFKLYKIAPKNYKRIIKGLFNNGGRPTRSAQPQPQPASQTPQASNYSGGHTQGPAPSSVTYNMPATPSTSRSGMPP